MSNFADRLVDAIRARGNPCIVGLDPRLDQMPAFVTRSGGDWVTWDDPTIRDCIRLYHQCVIDAVCDLVPGVKLQAAFYEQYGIGGFGAFFDTISYAKRRGLLVIVDAKRNDIASTAEAYANTYLGRTTLFKHHWPLADADCMTVSPYLGVDSLEPFLNVCRDFGKGIFILVKTSNKGSKDLQDLTLASGERLYTHVAGLVREQAADFVGKSGYSSVGAVVGATFPEEAAELRRLLPTSFFLVPGYGAQGGSGQDVVPCFNPDGLGAVVNASRSVTYSLPDKEVSQEDLAGLITIRTQDMIADIRGALAGISHLLP